MSGTKQILVEEKSSTRVMILNRPKQLNSLTYEMLCQLLDLFHAYEKDPRVKLLIVKGNGRAFCAGGDAVTLVRDGSERNWRVGAQFFEKDFTLDYLIATGSKTQVSILNGIVMGGGAGISIHGRFRVATENSVFAMPETALGIFPDVAASYFLSRLPGFFGDYYNFRLNRPLEHPRQLNSTTPLVGEYAGLTGSRLDGAEMLACGLATHFVSSERLSSLEEALMEADTSDPDIISAVINRFEVVPNLKEGSVFYQSRIINSCFSRKTVEEIISALEDEAAGGKRDDWLLAIIHSLKKASPTSLKITLRSIREGRLQGVGKCLVREYRMVVHVLKGEISKDFFEGCRAILMDKDRNPKWNPSGLELVTDDMVDKYFSNIDDELKLPRRHDLPAYAMAKL